MKIIVCACLFALLSFSSQAETKFLNTLFEQNAFSLPLTDSIIGDLNVRNIQLSLAHEKSIDLNFKITGNPDGQPIILLHGLDSSLITWKKVVEDSEFKQNYHALSIDLRGHGHSFNDHLLSFNKDKRIHPLRFHPTVMAMDIYRLLVKLNWKKSYIIGHSFGSRPAVELVRLFPERFSKLIFEDIGLRGNERDSILDSLELAKEHTQVKWVYPLNQRDIFLKDILLGYYGGDDKDPVIVQRFFKQFNGWRFFQEEGGYRMGFHPVIHELFAFYCARIDWTKSLLKVAEKSIPIHFILGSKGNGSAGVDYYQNQLPSTHRGHLKVDIIEGATHSVHKGYTKKFIHLIQ
jgi:pimeloyl-ACP methyl ester carboxylesterase